MPQTLFELDGPLASFTFNRPEARNAMTWEMYDALVDACETVDRKPAVRVLILRGAGEKAFVAGTDIAQFKTFSEADDAIRYEARLDAVLDRLERVTRPTIAAIRGVAAGAGCAIALACDFRVCTPESTFGVPIARTLGNCLSAANVARLLDFVGPARVKELLMTGRLADAGEAAALGLVNRVVPADGLDGAVRELVDTLAANAPLTLRATKEMLRRLQASRRIDPAEAGDLLALCYTSDDFREGVEAFLARRSPAWKGR